MKALAGGFHNAGAQSSKILCGRMFLPVVPASGVFDFCMRIKKRAGSFAELPCRALMGLKEHCGLSASGGRRAI